MKNGKFIAGIIFLIMGALAVGSTMFAMVAQGQYFSPGLYTFTSASGNGTVLSWSYVCFPQSVGPATGGFDAVSGWVARQCSSGYHAVGSEPCGPYACSTCPGGYGKYNCVPDVPVILPQNQSVQNTTVQNATNQSIITDIQDAVDPIVTPSSNGSIVPISHAASPNPPQIVLQSPNTKWIRIFAGIIFLIGGMVLIRER